MAKGAQGSFWETGEDELAQVRADLVRVRALVEDATDEVFQLNAALRPSDWAVDELKRAIARTHVQAGGKLQFNPEGAADRAPLFEQLTALAEQWGKTRTERAQRKQTLRGYQRELKRLASIIESAHRRKTRRK
jgi:septal ring factor EnvC (AmiA/AmiB activator)